MNYKLINKYVANLAVWNIKLHNLHWNVKGPQFVAVHNFTEEMYNDVFVKYDDAAELLKIQGQQPPATIKAYAALADIDEPAADSFSEKEVFQILIEDTKAMSALASEIRSSADETDNFGAANMMEDHIASYQKNLWFLNSLAK